MRLVPVSLVLLAACGDPLQTGATVSDAVAPDLADAVAHAAPGETMRVLVVPTGADDAGPRIAEAGGRVVERFQHVPVTVAELDADGIARLAATGRFHLTPDRPIGPTGASCGASATSAGKSDSSSRAAKTDAKSAGVALTSDASLVRKGLGADLVSETGAGVVVALVDSGVRTNHPDFPSGLVVASKDFVSGDDAAATKDPYGHGTMVAGVLVGQRAGVEGVSPGVKLVSARVLDDAGVGTTSEAIAAVDWIVDHADETGVRVINFSVGAVSYESFTTDPLDQAVEAAIDAGIVVVAAAGNQGTSDGATVYGGIESPANHPWVVTVGATDSAGTARRGDDRVTAFSSRGPTPFDGLGKPDLVAPGYKLALAARSGSTLWTSYPSSHLASYSGVTLDDAPYAVASGTSFAAPAVSGVAALMLQADPTLTPTEVKAALELSASDVGDPTLLAGGVGEVNAAGAVRIARYWASGGASPATSDVIAGETVPWGLTLLWDGYDTSGLDLSSWNDDGTLAIGTIDGSGILWDGLDVRYVGVRLTGSALLDVSYSDATWGNGILWDGGLDVRSGRVWSSPAWTSAFVWPGDVATSGATSPLFSDPAPKGLTKPVAGADDPLPTEPVFGE